MRPVLGFLVLWNILQPFDFTWSACRSPACDPANGPSWQLPRWARQERALAQDPPACFAFHRGQSLSCQSESSPLRTLAHSASLRHPPLSGRRIDERQESGNNRTTLVYSMAWEENILRCLISTVGKAILTKPINPWVSDGTDLIPPAADVPASLSAAVLIFSPLLCSTPLCTAQKHQFSQWYGVLICEVNGLKIWLTVEERNNCACGSVAHQKKCSAFFLFVGF